MEIYSNHSGGQKTKIKVWAGMVPSGGSTGESFPCLSPSFWWLLAMLGLPQLVATWLQSLPLSSHGLLFSVSYVCFP